MSMSYVNPNYPNKKAFIEAVKSGKKHETYNPSGVFPTPQNGRDVIEGPHYPQPHKWYAAVTVENGMSDTEQLAFKAKLFAAATQALIHYDTLENTDNAIDVWNELINLAPKILKKLKLQLLSIPSK